METQRVLVDGVHFDPAKESVEIHDSHGRLIATMVLSALICIGALWLFWFSYEAIFHGPRIRRAVVGLVIGPLAFITSLYVFFFALRRVFDGRPDLIIDRGGITDRWLGCGLIPWDDIYTVESWTHPDSKRVLKRERLLLYVKGTYTWRQFCAWHVRFMHWLDTFFKVPGDALPIPAASSGCPIAPEALLWIISQYRPSAIKEPVEIDPLNDEFLYRSPTIAAQAIRTLYGKRANDIVDQYLRDADEFHAAKWRLLKAELAKFDPVGSAVA